jgi:hypothetical protein
MVHQMMMPSTEADDRNAATRQCGNSAMADMRQWLKCGNAAMAEMRQCGDRCRRNAAMTDTPHCPVMQ